MRVILDDVKFAGNVEIDATTTKKGLFFRSSSVDNSTLPDATDLDSALLLINDLKNKLNAKLQADRSSGQQAT